MTERNTDRRLDEMRNLLITIALVVTAASAAWAEPVRVIAFGDSITRGFGDGSASCSAPNAGYPPRLRNLLAAQGRDAVFINEGICGERTSEGLTRIDSVLQQNPDASVVMIMEGTNDLSGFVSMETLRFNISEMARKSEDRGMTPIVLSAIPRGPGSGRDNDNTRTGFFAGWLAYDTSMANRLFGDPFTGLINVAHLFDLYYSDPWHPNRPGYDLLTQLLLGPALAAIDPPPPPFGLTCTTETGEPAFPAGPCVTDPEDDTVLCLREDRFRLDLLWRDFDQDEGVGHRSPLTSDTGTFYFFNPGNTELIVKVLDGAHANDHFWVFYGALSNVRYSLRVVDTQTGACKVYDNPEGVFASVGDTQAFPSDPEPSAPEATAIAAPGSSPAAPAATAETEPVEGGEPMAGCVADDTALCLMGKRYRVTIDWQIDDEREGQGMAIPLSQDTGAFYFFRDTNIEVVAKVLDGTGTNGNVWVFYGALSNLAYTMTVTDTETGAVRIYENPRGTFGSIGDTQAFPSPAPLP